MRYTTQKPVQKSIAVVMQALFLGFLLMRSDNCASDTFDKPRPRYLQSGAKDVIRIQKGERPDRHASIDPGSGAAEMPSAEIIDARLVTVCLHNPKDADGPKAFDIQKREPPRFAANAGAKICARFEPTRHTLYLWKTGTDGALLLVLSSPLDLSDIDGTQVSLDWLRDR